MKNIMHKIGKISSFLTKYIGVIIIAFSVLAFFWRDGFAWTTKYTSVFLGVAMFGMGLTIRMEDFKVVFSRPKEVLIGFVSQYTIMPLIAWTLCMILKLPTELALGVILVGCCPGGTASNVITYIAGGDVALSVGMTIASTLIAPLMTPLLVYILAGTWVEVSFWAMVISVVKVILIPVLLGILIRTLFGKQIEKISEVLPLISVVSIVMIISGIVAINAEKIVSCGVLVLIVVAIHNLCGMGLGLLAAKIFHIEYSKATAIRYITDYLKIPMEDTVAIGDSNNDLPMLKYAHTSIAMGNSSKQVLEVADYITTDVDKDGIWNALKWLGVLDK